MDTFIRAAECGQSVQSFAGSESGAPPVFEEAARLRVPDDDDLDIILPHFQRVAISGEDTSGVRLFHLLYILEITGVKFS